jgi:hypothetical protein
MESPASSPLAIVEEYHHETLPEEGIDMEFRLTYEGPLASDGDATEKQRIRRHLHPQLRELWRVDPHLSEWHECRKLGFESLTAHQYEILSSQKQMVYHVNHCED